MSTSAVDLARQVVVDLGGHPERFDVLAGGANHVVRVRGRRPDGTPLDWVVRSPLDAAGESFAREAWAARAARQVDVPTADVVHAGTCGGLPVMVVEHVPEQADADVRPWLVLGEYSQRLGAVPLDDAPDDLFSRFGRDLPRAWSLHLRYNLDALTPDDPLAADGAYAREHQPLLRSLVSDLTDQPMSHGLAHGDLSPHNLVTQDNGRHVLLDYGNARVGPTPWTDIQFVYLQARVLHTFDDDVPAELARAAGLPDPHAVEQTLLRLTVLQLLDVARWARERRPDLYPHYLQQCRTGLATLLP